MFLKDGRKVRVLGKVKEGVVVAEEIFHEEYDTGYSELSDGEIRIVDKVYEVAPTEVYDKEIEKKIKLIKDLDKEIADKIKYKSNINKELEYNLKVIEKTEVLRDIRKFLEGGFTHYVVKNNYRIKVINASEAKCSDDNSRLRLLTLVSDIDGNFGFRLGYYYDGSGGHEEVYPFCSYDDAVSKAKELIENEVNKWANDEKVMLSRSFLSDAEKIGVSLPLKYKKEVERKEIDKLNNQAEDLLLKLGKVQEEIKMRENKYNILEQEDI